MDGLPPTVRLLGIGWFIAACIVVGIGGGLLLDNEVGTKPLFTFVGLFLGLGIAFRGTYDMIMETMPGMVGPKRTDDDEKDEGQR
jgi:F0F1-type ATP synthase assembly protein I